LVIAHKDTENPHCHVIIDLVQEDGRLKPSSHEGRKLSRFALEHEKRVHGHAIVATREENIKALESGQQPQRSKKTARSTYELAKITEQKNHPRHKLAGMISDRQKRLEQAKEALNDRHRRHTEELLRLHMLRLERNKSEHHSRLTEQLRDADAVAAQKMSNMQTQHFNDRAQFNHNEKSLRGVLRNAFEASRQAEALAPSSSSTGQLTRLFGFLTREADRRAVLSDHQQEAEKSIKKELDRKQQQIKREERNTLARLQREERAAYLKKSLLMEERQSVSRARLDEQQKSNTRRRNVLLQEERRQQIAEKQRRSQEKATHSEIQAAEVPERQRTRKTRQPRDPSRSRRKRDQVSQEDFQSVATKQTEHPELTDNLQEQIPFHARDSGEFELEL
jgi:hypothetical protein